jgi:hypothetical protein
VEPGKEVSEPTAADDEMLRAKMSELGRIDLEKRMIHSHVDEQAVA